MPAKQPSIYIPTGYEAQQRTAERKRKIAETLLAKGLGQQGHMQSWMQVLGQLGTTFAGNRLDKQADKMTDEVNEQIKQDYANRLTAFQEKTNALDPTSPEYDAELRELVQGAQGDPLLADAAKPYAEAFGKSLADQGEMTNFGGQMRRKGAIREGEFEPNKPTDRVLRSGPEGRDFVPNPVAITAALASQPNVSITGGVSSMADPMMQQQGPGGMTAMPPQAPASPQMPSADEASMVFQNMTPEDKQQVNLILQKYAGAGASMVDAVPNNVPYGNPTSPTMPGGAQPAGVTTDGKPYWLVNGVPYDNPEGR